MKKISKLFILFLFIFFPAVTISAEDTEDLHYYEDTESFGSNGETYLYGSDDERDLTSDYFCGLFLCGNDGKYFAASGEIKRTAYALGTNYYDRAKVRFYLLNDFGGSFVYVDVYQFSGNKLQKINSKPNRICVSPYDANGDGDYDDLDLGDVKNYGIFTPPIFYDLESLEDFANTAEIKDFTKVFTGCLPGKYYFNKNGGLTRFKEDGKGPGSIVTDREVPYPMNFSSGNRSVYSTDVFSVNDDFNLSWSPSEYEHELQTEIICNPTFWWREGYFSKWNYAELHADFNPHEFDSLLGEPFATVPNTDSIFPVSYADYFQSTYDAAVGYFDYNFPSKAHFNVSYGIWYARNYYIDEKGVKHCSLWVKTDTMNMKDSSFDKNTDDDNVVLDEDGNELPQDEFPSSDKKGDSDEEGSESFNILDFFTHALDVYTKFMENLKSLMKVISDMPAMFVKLLSWFPGNFSTLFALAFTICIILRILGR